MVAAPAPPDRSTKAAGGAGNVVTGLCAGRVFHPWPRSLAHGYDGTSVAGCNGSVAASRVTCAVSADLADGLVGEDLVQHFGQHGRIADLASGDLDSPDFQGIRVNPKMHLAPLVQLRGPV